MVDRLNEVLRHDGDRAMRAVGLVGGMSEARQRRLLSYRYRFLTPPCLTKWSKIHFGSSGQIGRAWRAAYPRPASAGSSPTGAD